LVLRAGRSILRGSQSNPPGVVLTATALNRLFWTLLTAVAVCGPLWAQEGKSPSKPGLDELWRKGSLWQVGENIKVASFSRTNLGENQ